MKIKDLAEYARLTFYICEQHAQLCMEVISNFHKRKKSEIPSEKVTSILDAYFMVRIVETAHINKVNLTIENASKIANKLFKKGISLSNEQVEKYIQVILTPRQKTKRQILADRLTAALEKLNLTQFEKNQKWIQWGKVLGINVFFE